MTLNIKVKNKLIYLYLIKNQSNLINIVLKN